MEGRDKCPELDEALEENEAFEIIEVTRQGEWVSFTARKK